MSVIQRTLSSFETRRHHELSSTTTTLKFSAYPIMQVSLLWHLFKPTAARQSKCLPTTGFELMQRMENESKTASLSSVCTHVRVCGAQAPCQAPSRPGLAAWQRASVCHRLLASGAGTRRPAAGPAVFLMFCECQLGQTWPC